MPTVQQAAAAIEASRSAAQKPASDDDRVTPLELFFDLVFVFAVTQVTQLLADRPTWEGLAQALILLTLVWWAWAGYAWLTNTLDTDRDGVRLVMFAAMIAMFVVSLAIPGAFGQQAVLFAVAYSVVRAAHILLFGLATNEASVKQAVRGLTPTVAASCALVLAASSLDGLAQGAVFLVAIAIDYGGGLRGAERWTLHSGYFAERHGLIILIALGESVVATGIGAADTDLGAAEITAGALAMSVAAALWWAYFDVVALVAEHRLQDAVPGRAQNALARDAYSYLHLVFIAAIVLVALGSKKVIGAVDEPLKLVPAVALCGGLALYLLGHVAFRLRTLGTLNRQRLVAAATAAALIPLAAHVDALVTLALVTVVACALIAYEAIRFRETRALVRARARARTATQPGRVAAGPG